MKNRVEPATKRDMAVYRQGYLDGQKDFSQMVMCGFRYLMDHPEIAPEDPEALATFAYVARGMLCERGLLPDSEAPSLGRWPEGRRTV